MHYDEQDDSESDEEVLRGILEEHARYRELEYGYGDREAKKVIKAILGHFQPKEGE